MVIPSPVAHQLLELRLISPDVKMERDHRPGWLGEYICTEINSETLPLTVVDSMQYDCALDRLLKEVIFDDTNLGTLYMLKADLSKRFTG